ITSWLRPCSSVSMRTASSTSAGFSSRCSSITTIVSAPRTNSPGTARAFSRARRLEYASGVSLGSGASGIWLGTTRIGRPSISRSCFRRGEAEARVRILLGTLRSPLQDQGHRPVVDERHIHHRAEFACLHLEAGLPELRHEVLVERDRL